jgi:hypothetical protein
MRQKKENDHSKNESHGSPLPEWPAFKRAAIVRSDEAVLHRGGTAGRIQYGFEFD